jgi:hypothetical protein
MQRPDSGPGGTLRCRTSGSGLRLRRRALPFPDGSRCRQHVRLVCARRAAQSVVYGVAELCILLCGRSLAIIDGSTSRPAGDRRRPLGL